MCQASDITSNFLLLNIGSCGGNNLHTLLVRVVAEREVKALMEVNGIWKFVLDVPSYVVLNKVLAGSL